jgi:hypothetical protein
MSDLATIQAQLIDIRNVGTHKSLKLTLHVPEEYALKAIEAFGWPTGAHPVPVAVARLTDEASKAPQQQGRQTDQARQDLRSDQEDREETPPPVRRTFDSLPLPQQAGIMSNEPPFRTFLNEEYGYRCENKEDAAAALRERCGILSRKELKEQPTAAERFCKLRDHYRAWMMVVP